MINVFFRSILLFMLTVAVIRCMGKRQLAQLQPFEFVVMLMIADLAAVPIADNGTPLVYGVLAILALLVAHSVIAMLSMRFQRFRGWICGKPSVLIRNGRIDAEELHRLCYDLNDLMEAVRGKGVLNPADVGVAILETNGSLSVFPNAGKRPVTTKDMHLPTVYEGVPLTLVMGGQLQADNLELGGLDAIWLGQQLTKLGYDGPRQVFLCSLDTQGRLLVQGAGKQGKLHIVQALEPGQIAW